MAIDGIFPWLYGIHDMAIKSSLFFILFFSLSIQVCLDYMKPGWSMKLHQTKEMEYFTTQVQPYLYCVNCLGKGKLNYNMPSVNLIIENQLM